MFQNHISCLEVECATSALGRASVLPASCVFFAGWPTNTFFVGLVGGRRAVVMYPMYVCMERYSCLLWMVYFRLKVLADGWDQVCVGWEGLSNGSVHTPHGWEG